MELPNFFFYTQPNDNREKYTFSFGENGIHYTLMYVAHKKAFDFHKKDDNVKDIDNINPYEPFFEMSSFKFFRFLRKNAIVQEYLLKEFVVKNKINLGKLKKNNCWLLQLENVNFSQEVYNTERKGRMLKSNKKFKLDSMITEMEFLHPDEIKNINCNVFSVVKYKNGITTFEGFIYRINGKLYFWNKKNINQLMKLTIVSNYNLLSQINFINKDELLKKLYEIITRKYKSLRK
ncbi:hypothetical protein [Flavobacterium sasangense]|uniref:hypothetical protein n=1 Tax=Flavobacterium sasangense TaxID=503361 RepID=UPI00047AC0A8|nr:hypothetical protein [Flavobacterium sasangense]